MPVILSAIGKCYNISSPSITQVSCVPAHFLPIQWVKHIFSSFLIFSYHVINHRNSREFLKRTFGNAAVYETNTFLTYHNMNQGIVKLLSRILPGVFLCILYDYPIPFIYCFIKPNIIFTPIGLYPLFNILVSI